MASRSRRARSTGLLVVCATWLLLEGCAAGHEPIPQPVVSGMVCLPAPGGPVTQGTTVLRNQGDEPVRITRVALHSPRGITVVDVRVFVLSARHGATLVGALDEFPPESGPTSGTDPPLAWGEGTGVPGPELPADPDAVANVVLGVQRDALGVGTAEGIDVTYTAGGREYTWRGTTALTLAPARCP